MFKNGKIGIGTTGPSYNLHVVGTAGLSTGTAWTNASDARLKNIHGDYEYGLKDLYRLWFDDAQKTNATVAKQAREIASVKSENLRLKKENADIKDRLDRIEKLLSESK